MTRGSANRQQWISMGSSRSSPSDEKEGWREKCRSDQSAPLPKCASRQKSPIPNAERQSAMSEKQGTNQGLTPEQQFLNDLWEKHLREEFTTHDTNATLDTMVPNAYVNHIPVLTGGVGREQLREFYSRHFIPRMPPDTEIVPISRTIGTERLVGQMIFLFNHTVEMDWMLPGIAPTGRRVECPLVVIVHFRDGKLANEHLYWDQASVLVQLGLLDAANLPVAGLETARKLADPSFPSNHLIERAKGVTRPGGRA